MNPTAKPFVFNAGASTWAPPPASPTAPAVAVPPAPPTGMRKIAFGIFIFDTAVFLF
jgi:hypothetical protein